MVTYIVIRAIRNVVSKLSELVNTIIICACHFSIKLLFRPATDFITSPSAGSDVIDPKSGSEIANDLANRCDILEGLQTKYTKATTTVHVVVI